MTTYYIEIVKSRRRKRKAKFRESDVIRKNGTRKINERKDKKDAYETLLKQATKPISGNSFFLKAAGCEFFHRFSVCIEFHSIDWHSS